MTQKTFISPDNYRELSKPFKSQEEADAAIHAFWDELYELRNKHRIPDLTVVLCANVKPEDEDEGTVMLESHMGDELKRETMLAWAFGRAQADRQGNIARLIGKGSIASLKRGK